MKRPILITLTLLLSLMVMAGDRMPIWPKGKMPHAQGHQIAAMTDESSLPGFNPDRHRTPYLEWFAPPSPETRNGACMILISGGSYQNCCDVRHIKRWSERLTELGFQCVNLVYRTPRPV